MDTNAELIYVNSCENQLKITIEKKIRDTFFGRKHFYFKIAKKLPPTDTKMKVMSLSGMYSIKQISEEEDVWIYEAYEIKPNIEYKEWLLSEYNKEGIQCF